jgi:hypothetical protein
LENDPAMTQMSPVVSAADGWRAFDSAPAGAGQGWTARARRRGW